MYTLESALLERSPSAILFRSKGRDVSVAEVLNAANVLACQIPGKGPVVNVCADRCLFVIGFLAAIISKRTTLLPPSRHPATVQRLLDSSAGACLIHDEDEVKELSLSHKIKASLALDAKPESPVHSIPKIPDSRLCAIAYTSGSTGTPKANPKYWRTLRDGTKINGASVFGELGDNATVVATVPPQHMYGLETSVLAPLFLPLAVFPGRPFYPADIVEVLESLEHPRVLVTTPVHIRALLDAKIDVPRIMRLICATAPLDSSQARSAESTFADEVREVYGCTETGCIASRQCSKDEPWHLFPEFSLAVQDTSASVSASHLPSTVCLNDVLETSGPNTFRIVGRSSDLLNVAGKRGSIGQLTSELLSVDRVKDAVVFIPNPEVTSEAGRVAALVVTDRSRKEVLADLAQLVDPVFLPRPLLVVEHIPRTETGKVDRASLDAVLASLSNAQPSG